MYLILNGISYVLHARVPMLSVFNTVRKTENGLIMVMTSLIQNGWKTQDLTKTDEMILYMDELTNG